MEIKLSKSANPEITSLLETAFAAYHGGTIAINSCSSDLRGIVNKSEQGRVYTIHWSETSAKIGLNPTQSNARPSPGIVQTSLIPTFAQLVKTK